MEERSTEPFTPPKTKNHKRLYAIVAILIFVAAVALISVVTLRHDEKNKNQSAPPTPVARVTITARGFEPATLTVHKGTEVIWTNADVSMHQIVANPYPSGTDLRGLKSAILNQGQTYLYRADTVG